MKKNIGLFLILCLGVFFTGCFEDEKIQNDFVFKEFKTNDKILLHSVNGGSKVLVRTQNAFVLEGEEDKVLMIDFFGTFCNPCKEEALELSKLWKNNAKKFFIIGLTHFEDVSDEMVKKFADDYGAYYFLSNSKENDRIIAQILKDINYQNMEQLPFKVVIKDGIYQNLSDFWNGGEKIKYYLGKVPTSTMQEDLNRIYKGL